VRPIEVVVFAEGPSDEAFLKRVVAPALGALQIHLKPQTLRTSREASGGAINFDRLKLNVRNTLRQNDRTYLTTFFDLYALDSQMPGKAAAALPGTPSAKAARIEHQLHRALVDHVQCRPDRLFPHIQPYELEGLFFAEPSRLAAAQLGWEAYLPDLRGIRASAETPEHINDSFETKPSARLESILRPRYRKTLHAPLIGECIGLGAIIEACPHFAAWVAKLQSLRPL
jgi:Domain of unknown function (DUF4276)